MSCRIGGTDTYGIAYSMIDVLSDRKRLDGELLMMILYMLN
jgi:hypothetical protein